MIQLTIGSLFSGYGGIEHGLEKTGYFKTIWHSEIEPYPNAILQERWPEAPNLGNITIIDWEKVRSPDLLCGGFPCQDISNAGKKKGIIKGETKSGLWGEFHKAIRILRPRYVLIENVSALANLGLNIVLADLAKEGYDAEWCDIRASDFGAPHKRERLFIIAYKRTEDSEPTNTNVPGQQERRESKPDEKEHATTQRGSWWETEPELGGVTHGFTSWLDESEEAKNIKNISHIRILNYGNKTKTNTRETLRLLRSEDGTKAHEWETRGLPGISAKEILQSYLWKLSETPKALDDMALKSTKAQENKLRSVWNKNKPSRTPHRPEPREQFIGEHPDSLQTLSQFLAHDSEEAWIEYRRTHAVAHWEDGINRVAHGITRGLDSYLWRERIKALGNGVVPQITTWIGERIIQHINRKKYKS